MRSKIKIIRTSTIALSLDVLLKGQLKFLNENFDVVAISGKDNHLEKIEKREGVKTINVSMSRPIHLIKDLISLYKLYLVFKKEKPTIVHSITPKAGLLSMTAGYFSSVPIRIHTFTGLIFPHKKGLFQKLLILMDKILCFFATHVYPEGKGVKNDLLKFKITKKPLKVIANGNVNGIDTEYFSQSNISVNQREDLKQILNIKPSDFVFTFVGRVVKDKGINELISSFKKINNQNKNVKLILVGQLEQNLDPILPETGKFIENEKSVISVGYQEDIRHYLAITDVFVFPSYREGFPNVVLQAGAMDLPIIATNISGSNEIIEHKENGILINKKDEDSLYKAMKQMINNNDLRTKLSHNAREIIVQNYKQDIVWSALLDEYNSILNKI